MVRVVSVLAFVILFYSKPTFAQDDGPNDKRVPHTISDTAQEFLRQSPPVNASPRSPQEWMDRQRQIEERNTA